AQVVAGLGATKRLSSLFPKLIRDRNASKGGLCVQDGDANVPSDGVRKILRLLLRGFLAKSGLLRLGINAESSKQWEGKIHSSGRVPVRGEDSIRSDGCDPSHRQCRDGWQTLELLCGSVLLIGCGV